MIITIRDYSGQSFYKTLKGYETPIERKLKMYAIVETGGKQYQVEEGRYVDVELLDGEKDAKIVFDKVVMVVNGKKSKVGQPYVNGASAEGKIMLHDKSKKLLFTNKDLKKVIEKTRSQTRFYKSYDF